MTTKICKKCGIEQEVSQFSPCKENKDKLNSWCKSCHRQYQSNVRKNDPKKVKDRQKKHYEKVKQLGGWQVVYAESYKSAQQKYKKSNAAKISHKIRQHSYRKTIKGKLTQKKSYQNRRTNIDSSFSKEKWVALLNFYCPDNICLCCGNEAKLEMDHVIPLIKNGSNSINNIQPLCRSCNSKKHVSIIDYRHDKGEYALSLLE